LFSAASRQRLRSWYTTLEKLIRETGNRPYKTKNLLYFGYKHSFFGYVW